MHETDHLDPFALAHRNGETATDDVAANRASSAQNSFAAFPTHPAPMATPADAADSKAVTLFREWIERNREADNEKDDELLDAILKRGDAIEAEIFAIRGGALAALAIKTFLVLHFDYAENWAPRGVLRKSAIFDCEGGEGYLIDQFVIATLRDAASVVPEIGELAAALIHPDAELIDAELNVEWARIGLAIKEPPEKAQEELWASLDLIAATPAKTERGASIKERHRPNVRIIELLPGGKMLIERGDGRRGVYEPAVAALAAE